MRGLLAISLLTIFTLPLALPLSAGNAADSNLPLCCRRDGKHHCAARAFGTPQSGSMRTVREECPYSVAQPAILVLPTFTPSPSASVFAGIARHPSLSPQTEAQRRISFDRSRQKRGPPARIL